MSAYPAPFGPSALTTTIMLLVPLGAWSETPPAKPTPVEIGKLVRQLGDDCFEVREAATKKLLKIGLDALAQVEEATENGDPEVSGRAWHIIDRWASGGRVPALLYQLSAGSPPIKAGAAESLGKMEAKGQPALPGLIQATADATEYVRCSAQDAVKKIQATLPLRLEVKQPSESVEVETTTVFRIDLSNQGQDPATQVRMTATVPEGLAITAIEGPIAHKRDGNKIVSEPMTLEANEARYCEIHVKPKAPGQVRVQVQVHAEGLNAPVIGEAGATVTPPAPTAK